VGLEGRLVPLCSHHVFNIEVEPVDFKGLLILLQQKPKSLDMIRIYSNSSMHDRDIDVL
jgi:hypothetical protein